MKLLISLSLLLMIWMAPHVVKAQEVVDSDHDGASDRLEVLVFHTDPNNADTDGDGVKDGVELMQGRSPLVAGKMLREVDSDNDGAWDDWEIRLGLDLMNPDTDGDGYSDGVEIADGYDPRNKNPERLSQRIEINLKEQKLTYFLGAMKLDEFDISSGVWNKPTPPGSYEVLEKKPVVDYIGPGYRFLGTKWNLMFKRATGGNYYVHGAYWHNKFGRQMSHGCVNVPYSYSYMGRMYDWARVGTAIEIT